MWKNAVAKILKLRENKNAQTSRIFHNRDYEGFIFMFHTVMFSLICIPSPADSELPKLAELTDTRNTGHEFQCSSQTTVG